MDIALDPAGSPVTKRGYRFYEKETLIQNGCRPLYLYRGSFCELSHGLIPANRNGSRHTL